MRHRQRAICLRATDFSETSQVLCFLTPDEGTVRVLGKGTKRPKSKSGGTMDFFSEGELIYSSKPSASLATLIEFTETVSHEPLRKSKLRLNTALYMLEVVSQTIGDGDRNVEVFDLLHNALERLGQDDAPIPAVLAFFQWRLLRHAGLLGQLTDCVSCSCKISGKPSEKVSFSSQLGGLVCDGCRGDGGDFFPIEPETLEGLDILTAVESGRACELGKNGKKASMSSRYAECVNRMLAYHIAQQIGKWPKMTKHAIRGR